MGSDLSNLILLIRYLNQHRDGASFEEAASALNLPASYLVILASRALPLLGIRLNLSEDSSNLSLAEEALDLLDEDKIYRSTLGRGRVSVVPCTESTNTALLESSWAVHQDALLAEVQTAGRGRRGNAWQARFGEDLMLSMRFAVKSLEENLGLSIAAGVSALNALEKLGLKGAKIKWPNDLYYDDGKLCGILVESRAHGLQSAIAVIGIGLNVHGKGQERSAILDRRVVTLEDFAPFKLERNSIAAALITELKASVKLLEDEGLAPFIERFAEADFLYGQKVSLETGGQSLKGTCDGVDERGYLKLKIRGKTISLPTAYNIRAL